MTLTKINLLGMGGFGIVDLVEDENGQQFARKTFSVNQPLSGELLPNVLKRFIREARMQRGMDHPNIVPIVGGNLKAEPPYYLMPVAVTSLDKELRRDRQLGGNYKTALMDIVAGLEEMHSVRMLHRDLKPQNVLKFEKNGGAYYAICDFGFVSIKDSTLSKLTTTGMSKGSDYYTAPELIASLRKGTTESDVFSLGCILHDMVGTEERIPGREIREAGDFELIFKVCTRDDPARRISSVSDFRELLTDVDAAAIEICGDAGVIIEKFLDEDVDLEEGDCEAFADYLDDELEGMDSNQKNALFLNISLKKIKKVCDEYKNSADRLGGFYGQWVQDAVLNFETCDVIAKRAAVFIENTNLESQVECLLGLLKMGTSHNRWYVEQMFIGYCGEDMDDNLAKRFAIEFRAIGKDICPQINHLERSISAKTSQLHHQLQKAITSLCN